MTELQSIPVRVESSKCPDCADHDDECHDIADKVACYLYDPARGMCPYIRSQQEQPAR